MPKKSRAEIQRAHRKRKKPEDKNYLKRESERVLKYHKPAGELNATELNERRERNRDNKRRSRENKRKLEEDAESSSPLRVRTAVPPAVRKRQKIKEINKKFRRLENCIDDLKRQIRK